VSLKLILFSWFFFENPGKGKIAKKTPKPPITEASPHLSPHPWLRYGGRILPYKTDMNMLVRYCHGHTRNLFLVDPAEWTRNHPEDPGSLSESIVS